MGEKTTVKEIDRLKKRVSALEEKLEERKLAEEVTNIICREIRKRLDDTLRGF